MVELLGVMGSVLVLISFVLNGEKRIRVANIFGAALFVVYGIMINAFSVWFLNGALLFVHFYKLLKMRKI